MLYQKIDLTKLYEQASNQTEGGDNQAAESFPEGADAARSAKSEILKGNAYAFPVKKEEYNEIMSLINSGSGDWMSKEPIKFLMSGREATEPATMRVGEANKPVYLMIRLSKSKGDTTSKPLVLEKEDRIYVALVTSAENLRKNLEEADNIAKSVKLPVLTPLMKSGKNVEHSIQMWLDFEEGSPEVVKDADTESSKTENETNVDNMDNVEQIQSEQPGLAAQLDLPESKSSLIKDRSLNINEEKKVYTFDQFLKSSNKLQ
jgi:hypothetical protein